MIRNLKLGPKLIGGFGAVLGLFICVIGMYHFSVEYALSSFNNLMETELAISDHAGQIEALMLNARVEEADFIISNDISHQEKLNTFVNQVVNEARRIETLADQSGNTQVSSKVKDIISGIRSYEHDFGELVKAVTLKGVGNMSGLRGKFRATVEKFKGDMEQFEADDYYIELLKIDSAQKEYLIYKSAEAKNKLKASIDALNTLAMGEANGLTREVLHALILDIIPDYMEAFNRLEKKQGPLSYDMDEYKTMNEGLMELMDLMTSSYFKGAKAYALDIRRNEKNYLITGSDEDASATKASVQKILDEFNRSSIDPDFIDQAKLNLVNYLKDFDTLVAIDKQIAELMKRLQESVNNTIPLVVSLKENTQTLSHEKRTLTENRIKQKILFALCIGIGAFFLGIGLAILITRSITKPIKETVSFAEGMTKGDLTRQLTVKNNDEMGLLATALNTMVSTLNQMFREISSGVDELNAFVTVLKDISGQMLKICDNTLEKSNFVSSASEDMKDNIGDAAQTIDDSSEKLTLISKTTEQMNLKINDISQTTENARKISSAAVIQAGEATQKITQLETAAANIGKVTDTIRNISDQTKMLALNATIESMRAGQAGSGFAVVAGEIKTLAQQSAVSTQEISELIEGVQALSSETTAQIKAISDTITTFNDVIVSIATAMTEQSGTTREISSNITLSSDGIQKINHMMTQNIEALSQIVKDIIEVRESSEGMSSSVVTINYSSDNLSELSGRLKDMVSRFTL